MHALRRVPVHGDHDTATVHGDHDRVQVSLIGLDNEVFNVEGSCGGGDIAEHILRLPQETITMHR